MNSAKILITLAVLIGLSTALARSAPGHTSKVASPGGQLPGNPKIALVKVAGDFTDPINVTNAGDGTGRIFVVERAGCVKVVTKSGVVKDTPFLDLSTISAAGSDVETGYQEQGLYSLAFHPSFKENGYFFVHYASAQFNGDGVIKRFTVDPKHPNAVSAAQVKASAKVILRIKQPWSNHNGGQIAFGPDGMLYIALGDGGSAGDPHKAGQDLTNLLAKILRIDVDTNDANIAYTIPGDNPFATVSVNRLMTVLGKTQKQAARIKKRLRPEIWSYGVRNPYEFTFDPLTGDMFIADVGQNHWEEINFEQAGDGGHNYGWPRMEASYCYPLSGNPANNRCKVVGTLPAAQYPHNRAYPGAARNDTGGCSVQGFGVANYASMSGVYLVGDWCSGRLFGAGHDGKKWQLQSMMKTELRFTAGGYDEDHKVLIVNAKPVGTLWRVLAANNVPKGAVVAQTVN